LKLTAEDMKGNKLVDGIIPEPLGGAHLDFEQATQLKNVILETYKELSQLTPEENRPKN
jgi:acetyl-CoA carboxylase carboxyl transferase subunit alpha